MRRQFSFLLLAGFVASDVRAQRAFTWQELRDRLTATNPTLQAGQINIDESRASEITAYLRPNPNFSLSADGLQVSRNFGVWRPLSGVVETPSFSYLHERGGKRELRRDDAQEATGVAVFNRADLQRNLVFNLRTAFVQTLQAKAWLQLARDNLTYWDKELQISRDRFSAGDIAEADLDRLELQRIQYETDVNTATVNLRTAKIQLQQLVIDRTPVDQFDVTGPYEFSESIPPMEEFHTIALDARPDLKAAAQNVELARVAHNLAVANGSTDPTFSVWYSHNPSFSNSFANETMGASVSIPLRIFDRNQGEKAKTELDIGRNERLRDAAEAQVLSDVDSAYVTLMSTLNLLRPYKATYLPRAAKVRDTVSFSYQNGGASLLDFLDSQQAYRATEVNYINLIGSYLSSAAQLNLAVGQEVIQ
jgi:cobalt-zinc-cadmium efflux system outer membrane protein